MDFTQLGSRARGIARPACTIRQVSSAVFLAVLVLSLPFRAPAEDAITGAVTETDEVGGAAGSEAAGGEGESREHPGEEDAEADEGFAREGAWIGVGGAFADEDFERKSSYDDSGALMFRAGYRGLPNVGVELLGEVLPEFEQKGSGNDGDVDGFAVTANGKLFLPLGPVEPWVMGGIGFLDIDRSRKGRRDDFVFRFAAGLDAYVTPHVAFYLEGAYMLPTGDVKDFAYSTYGGGILFRF